MQRDDSLPQQQQQQQLRCAKLQFANQTVAVATAEIRKYAHKIAETLTDKMAVSALQPELVAWPEKMYRKSTDIYIACEFKELLHSCKLREKNNVRML